MDKDFLKDVLQPVFTGILMGLIVFWVGRANKMRTENTSIWKILGQTVALAVVAGVVLALTEKLVLKLLK